jgi:F0F1-type ATP synthase assembly protein I
MKQGAWGPGLELVSVGIELVVASALGYFGGNWLDGRLHTAPAFAAVGLLLGSAAGFVQLFRVANAAARRAGKDGERGG